MCKTQEACTDQASCSNACDRVRPTAAHRLVVTGTGRVDGRGGNRRGRWGHIYVHVGNIYVSGVVLSKKVGIESQNDLFVLVRGGVPTEVHVDVRGIHVHNGCHVHCLQGAGPCPCETRSRRRSESGRTGADIRNQGSVHAGPHDGVELCLRKGIDVGRWDCFVVIGDYRHRYRLSGKTMGPVTNVARKEHGSALGGHVGGQKGVLRPRLRPDEDRFLQVAAHARMDVNVVLSLCPPEDHSVANACHEFL
mmetsp:Transcript_28788/g.61796  ORF Transcript_28788/g.61796 Transcript_28788/m.61796 type:complete len:250 (-) Transcript_28788:113-862(-)